LTTAVVFAYSEVGVRCLKVLIDAGVRIPLVVTHKDSPWEKIWFSSVAALSKEQGISFVEDPPALDIPPADFLFSFYYRRMLPPEVLKKARKGAYNMHGSLLPKYRGRAPVNWAVLKGETETGATLHEMTEKPDAGRIVDQQAVPIGPDDTAAEVFARVVEASETVLRRSLKDLVSGKAKLVPQDLSKGSYYGARKPEDGRIDWSKSAQEIHNLVRAVAPPFPGAFTDGLKIFRTRILPGTPKQSGPYKDKDEWFAGCGDNRLLRLLETEETR
jgi:methionyl-tRNA formyltransferase